MRKNKLLKLKNGNEKCPYCFTIFEHGMESLHPFDIAVREQFKKRRSNAAKRGWKKRKARENDPDRDRARYV